MVKLFSNACGKCFLYEKQFLYSFHRYVFVTEIDNRISKIQTQNIIPSLMSSQYSMKLYVLISVKMQAQTAVI